MFDRPTSPPASLELERKRHAENSAVAGNSPRSDTPLRDLISRLEDRAKGLHAGYDALEERLDTILRPVPPNVATNARPGVETQVPESHLVGRLRFLLEAFDALDQRYQYLYARVEL